MTSNAVATFSTALLLLLATPSSKAQTYTGLTGEEASAVLNNLGLVPELPTQTDTGSIKIRFEDGTGRSTLFLHNCRLGPDGATRCSTLQAKAGYIMVGKPTLAQINEWNRTRMFSRAYLDSDGDPHIEAALNLEAGVGSDAVKAFLKTYSSYVSAFTRHVDFN